MSRSGMLGQSRKPSGVAELKIEITDACNASCLFCFQGPGGKVRPRYLGEEEVLGWIDWAVENAIPRIRFTGGEPTLHPRLERFCSYAFLKGRRVILNTNGLVDGNTLDALLPLVAQVRVSLPVTDPDRMDRVTGVPGSMAAKMRTVRSALAASVSTWMLTALLPENRGHLHEFVELMLEHRGIHWVPLRFMPTTQIPRPWSREDVQALAEEMAALMELLPELVPRIPNTVPFCAVSPVSLGARVFAGRFDGCGRFNNLTVSVRGRLKTCYQGYGLPPGSIPSLQSSAGWRLCGASVETLPQECKACEYLERCGGGCRSPRTTVKYRGVRIDHLAGFVA